MKKYLTLLLLSVSVFAFGQNGSRRQYSPKNNSFGTVQNRIIPDSAQHIPEKTAYTTNEFYNGFEQDTTAQLFTKKFSDSLIYYVHGRYYYLGGTLINTSGGTPSTCGAAASISFSSITNTSAVVNWTPVSGQTYSISATNGYAANPVSPPVTLTSLTAGTAYTVTLTTNCTTGTPNTSSNSFTTTGGSVIQFAYKFQSTDPYVDNSTAPDMTGATLQTITHNQDLVWSFTSAADNNYYIVRVPNTESAKVTWYHNTLNSGTIPDAVWRSSFTVGSYTYYVTRNQFALDPTSTIQLKQ